MKNVSYLTICLLTAFVCPVFAQNKQINNSHNGMVVCAYPDAAQAGLTILKKGGNAVDAAVAVQFALAVTFPEAGNIGGGGFIVYRRADGQTSALDFREKAPAKASANMFLDAQGNVVPGMSVSTHSASGVPGSVDGMVAIHKKYGKLTWAEDLQPAIDLAAKGFKITQNFANDLNSSQSDFKKRNPGKTYFIKNTPWKAGDIMVQPDLAKTLRLIRDKGRNGFYSGIVADEIVKEMKKGHGLISKQDLAGYHAVWRTPITGYYKGYKVITMPPPSSGGIALLQLLKSVENYPLHRWGYNQDSTVQLMVEAERRVYADRSKYLGDPDFYKVPVSQLLNPAYIQDRMKTFTWDAATPSTSIQPGKIPGYESTQTTHYSIVDRDGNAISITTTLNGGFGSKIVVGGAGFCLNNEMDDFSAKPGTPNMYGLLGGEANSIQPNKRILSSMTPTIIEKNGKLFMVVGTPGGGTIITSVFQTILNVLDFNQDMQQAVDSKRFHSQWLPDTVDVEPGALSTRTLQILRKKGYNFKDFPPIGEVDAILKTRDGYEGGADRRGDNTKLGW